MSIFVNLPLNIIIEILSYDNLIKYRSGKFINRLVHNDKRNNLLKKIPSKILLWSIPNNKEFFYIIILSNKYLIEYKTEHNVLIYKFLIFGYVDWIGSLIIKK